MDKAALIRLITERMAEMKAGHLEVEIPTIKKAGSPEEEELGRLVSELNELRLSLIAEQDRERERKAASDKLVVGMAHDLKTPLTGLLNLLELTRKQEDPQKAREYLERAYNKTLQLKELSNQLFEYFLINSAAPISLDPPEIVQFALGDYLSELYGNLEDARFDVSIEQLTWPPVKIRICTDYAARIINNLFSNVQKYADPAEPVLFSSQVENGFFAFTLQNRIARTTKYVEGTGIGVTNIRNMMRRMGGRCEVQIGETCYSIRLLFPLNGPAGEGA